jgi:hypothetical protein
MNGTAEIRNPKAERSTKGESPNPPHKQSALIAARAHSSHPVRMEILEGRHWAFGLLSDFGFWISDFAPAGFAIGLLLLLATALPICAEETNSPARFDIQSFRIISERNIFDPNRSSRSRGDRRERERERPSRTESFALVGTMSYEKGWFAFFDGTSSDFRKVVQPADSIAGYKVADIAPDYVKLAGNGQEVQLRVGMQMKRQDEGEWVSGERTESFDRTNTTASAGTTNETSTATGPESDILKKLMQQREQELNK